MTRTRQEALAAGSLAPEIRLPLMGGGEFTLAAARALGPVLLAFFKVNCPACQFSFPFLDRLAGRVSCDRLQVVGVGQNDAAATAAFVGQLNLHFPVALDSAPVRAASRAYGLTFVPAVFWIESTGRIRRLTVGFDRAEFAQTAEDAGAGPLFTPAEWQQLPARRPG